MTSRRIPKFTRLGWFLITLLLAVLVATALRALGLDDWASYAAGVVVALSAVFLPVESDGGSDPVEKRASADWPKRKS